MRQAASHKTENEKDEHRARRTAAKSVEAIGEVAEHEKWLYNDPDALAVVKRGLADSAAERGVKMNFLEFADIDIDD